MKLSISAAAQRAGVRRTTIYRKLSEGKLSRETDDDGKPIIDLAELARVYPHAVSDPGHNPYIPRTGHVGGESATLRELVDTLRQEKDRIAAELDRVRADARADIERERAERERLLGLLESAQRQLADLRPKETPRRRNWLPWRR